MIKNKNKKKTAILLLSLLTIVSSSRLLTVEVSAVVRCALPSAGARATIVCGLRNDAVFATGVPCTWYTKNIIITILYIIIIQ